MRLLAASAVFGSWAFSTVAGPLSPENAAGHIGETATVCGVVASSKYEANVRSQPTLLDLGKPYPEAIFTAVIYGDIDRNSGPPRHHFAANELCDGADQRLPREAGDRSYRAEPVDRITRLLSFPRLVARVLATACSLFGGGRETGPARSSSAEVKHPSAAGP
jgi:hypothetical protein